jgi:signal transduction histidine kinase
MQEFILQGEEKTMPAHTRIFQQGDQADSFYIIKSGGVRIVRKCNDGLETELRKLGPNDSFGEMALLTGEPRSASVETLENTHLLVISRERFIQMLKENPDISIFFFKQFSNWIIHTDSMIERSEEELRKSYERLHTLSLRIAEIEEFEKQKLARELHDEVGSKLTALSINLDFLVEQLSDESKKIIISRLHDSKVLIKETMKIIRNIMSNLRPLILDDNGLITAIHVYIEKFSKRTKIPIIFKGDEIKLRFASEIETNLFRIIQESLTNVAKHAYASKVTLTLKEVDGKITLTITDDGVGFNPGDINKIAYSKGLGLIGMRERTEALGGNISVSSSPGKGTRIIVEVKR